jgi:hypothetical protein
VELLKEGTAIRTLRAHLLVNCNHARNFKVDYSFQANRVIHSSQTPHSSRRMFQSRIAIEREEQEHRQQPEQGRIECLLDEAVSLRRATDIRAYVDAVKAIVAKETASISSEKIERWWKWALAEADRVDPVRSARFLVGF